MRIKDAINKVFWTESSSLDKFTLILRDRKKGSIEVPFPDISSVDNNYIYLKDDTIIPLHRVIEIRKGNETWWRR
ncbi:DUF504 domain-containing protein [Sulfolobus acidocaldarius]|nr:RNA repair domain-containing protein [Sulfolobus acidocaldarius]